MDLSRGSLALNALGSKAQSTPVANLNDDDGKRQRWLMMAPLANRKQAWGASKH